MKNRVLRDYSGKQDGQLGDFGLHIATSLTGNANFTTPAITPAALTTQATGFNASVAALNGTQANTLAKNTLRAALVATLDQLATYVELTANGDAAKIVSSGFTLASTTRSPQVPGMASIQAITNEAAGKLRLALAVADNAWTYIVEYTDLTTNAVKTQSFTDPHDAVLVGLVSGHNYSIRVQVMGSGNQTTEWCDPVTHMAT